MNQKICQILPLLTGAFASLNEYINIIVEGTYSVYESHLLYTCTCKCSCKFGGLLYSVLITAKLGIHQIPLHVHTLYMYMYLYIAVYSQIKKSTNIFCNIHLGPTGPFSSVSCFSIRNVMYAGPAVGIPATNTTSCLRMLQSSLADVKNIVDGTK